MSNIKEVNKKIKEHVGAEKFEDRVRQLVAEGILEIVDCEDDGTPIVKCTELGLTQALVGIKEYMEEDHLEKN